VSDACRFVRAHPTLSAAMGASVAFPPLRDGAAIEVDDERLYIVHGDTLGDVEDLYLESLVRGALATDEDDPNRAVYLELEPPARALVDQRLSDAGMVPRRRSTAAPHLEGDAR